ncbi:nitrilase-related carbon-nitrogen hydrolase [Streptacidiphilus jiangxiensis]|uniref:Predicted amidohydrolase n=1 Tax=Streptacidiphilus jiangxiensis TaxID=235985 RepID=A0A1H7PPK8_STRJI|nr:nitrilase-related carbon-nitrogen hydrolase [Streptacidiphilus jiangxiensis]SEL37185.1 Predicted amidohydrolase [Streptacidiphilus jiangxiensis]
MAFLDSDSTTTRIACAQLTLRIGEPEANRAAARDAIERAAAAGAEVVVLPELTNSGCIFHDAAEAAAAAEPLDGPTVADWTAAARRHRLVIVGGLCERDGDGLIRNSAVLVDQTGLRAVHRKAHFFGGEQEFFVAGDELPPVVETSVGRIGVMVCYDQEFPEYVRTVVLRGAELLCVPVNWPLFPRPAGERPSEVVRVQANAAVNRMFVAACDRAGTERGVPWTGGSVIVDLDGFPVAGPATEKSADLLLADCALATARDKRLGEHNDVLGDRRPDLYRSVTTPLEEAR